MARALWPALLAGRAPVDHRRAPEHEHHEDRSTPPDAGDPLAIPLELLDRHGLALGGGKARNLGALIRAGFPVPRGFVLTTRAYELVSIAAGLGPILEELARVRPSERERLSALAARSAAGSRVAAVERAVVEVLRAIPLAPRPR